jgi:hypothetical protein
MIQYQKEYEIYIRRQGVGSKDQVADSVQSYISYLNGVARHLNIIISPKLLSSEKDINILSSQLSKTRKVSAKTIKNYCSAMRHYVGLVRIQKIQGKLIP